MKKIISSLALAAFITAGITGCGGETPAPKKDDKKAVPAAPTGGKDAAKEAPKK